MLNEFSNLNITIKKNNKFKKTLIKFCEKITFPLFIAILSFTILTCYISYNLFLQSKLKEETFRLHIVANSDNEKDQIIKLKITEKTENYLSKLLDKESSKEKIYTTLEKNIDEILLMVNNELKNNNANYIASIKLGDINYDKKQNTYLNMPKGSYDSMQILLGNAEGKNYWNLIFPNKENIQKLEGLNNILPGITNIFNTSDRNQKDFKLKIFEILNLQN